MSVMAGSEFNPAEVAAKRSWENSSLENGVSLKSRPSNEFRPGRPPLASTNGTSLNRKTSRDVVDGPMRTNSYENGVQSRRVGELGQQHQNISKSTSEPDSLIDMYKMPNTRSNSKVDLSEKRGNNTDTGPHEDDLNNKWIHRDKLAKIESEELQAAGINLATTRRPMSKSGNRRAPSRNNSTGTTNGVEEPIPQSPQEAKRRRPSSPVVEDTEEEPEHMNWDLRTSEEIAAEAAEEKQSSQMYSMPTIRKSGSRIPVFTSSPLPIHRGDIERSEPLPRKRNASGAGDDDDRYGSSRSRANSIGSQVLLDDYETIEPPMPTLVSTPSRPGTSNGLSSSPTKASKGSKVGNTPGSGTRKASAPASTSSNRKASGQKPRTTSNNNSPANRPTTRSGDQDRPKTAVNRPEGDPPWLATMYKPDPRLPPDQQIIPTHARRQQQAMWDNTGAVPTTYDRNFSPLAVHTADGLKPSPTPPRSPEKKSNSPDLGLRQVPSATPSRPGTSGGYSTMPTVKPQTQNQAPSPLMTQNQVPERIRQPMLPDEDEKNDGKKKGGCGCCIVM